MYIDLSKHKVDNNTIVSGVRLGDIHRKENMSEETGLCIARGLQGYDGSKYNAEVIASLPDGQAVFNITENKLFGK